MREIKQKLFDHCLQYLAKRIDNCRQAIQSAQESANEEDKNSSGDKYETARAMMQIEIEQNSTQLNEAMKLRTTLEKLNLDSSASHVRAGSLVVTSRSKYFLAISLGVIKLDEEFYVISPDSPIGAKMIGLAVNDSFTFANQSQTIKAIH